MFTTALVLGWGFCGLGSAVVSVMYDHARGKKAPSPAKLLGTVVGGIMFGPTTMIVVGMLATVVVPYVCCREAIRIFKRGLAVS